MTTTQCLTCVNACINPSDSHCSYYVQKITHDKSAHKQLEVELLHKFEHEIRSIDRCRYNWTSVDVYHNDFGTLCTSLHLRHRNGELLEYIHAILIPEKETLMSIIAAINKNDWQTPNTLNAASDDDEDAWGNKRIYYFDRRKK